MTSHINLKTMILATAQELENLCHNAENLQASIGLQAISDKESITSIQRLDYVTQSLEALSSLWFDLGDKTPQEWSLDAGKDIDNVLLKDLAARLQGKNVVPVSQGCLEEF